MIPPAPSWRTVPWLGVLLLAGPAIGCHKASAPEEEAAPQAPVRAEPARKLLLGERTDLFGTTLPLPNHSAHISAAVEGHVLSVLGDGKGSTVVEGQQVKAGQVIIQMDDRVPRASRAKLQSMLNDLEEQHKQAGFVLELARIDVNRLNELLRNHPAGGSLPLVSQVELQKAQVMQKDAQSKQKAVADKIAGARADLKALEEQLEFYTLRAPIAGRLSIIQAVPGQTLTPGTIVGDVVNLDPLDVLCYAPPRAAARLALEQTAKLILAEAPSTESQPALLGKVAFIDVQAQPQTGNIAVKVRFPNRDLRLRAHAVVRVDVLTQPEKERLTIPEAALMEDRAVPTVVVVQDVKTEKKDDEEQKVGKVRNLQAVLGVRDRDQHVVELLGLEDPETKEKVSPAGLLFVTTGGHGLKNDDVVILSDEAPQEAK